MKLNKYKDNPILEANPKNPWESLCVLNPGVIYDEQNKEFIMLYRAAGHDREHYIYIGLAKSRDGINFVRQSDKPVISPSPDNNDSGCVEDPRIVKLGEYYYITYASRAYPPGQYWSEDKLTIGDRPDFAPYFIRANSTQTNLCMTRDFVSYKKLGRITDSRFDDRDVIIFPEKVNGKYVRLSRPMEWCGKGFPCKNPSIWLSYSDDLMEWEKPVLLLEGQEWWEDKKIGGSCPPIKTPHGWFHIYHGVSTKDGGYRAGAVLLDLNNPLKVIARTKDFILEPQFDFETKGYYNGCVFPTANCVVDGTLYVYYGGADKCICAATVDFQALLDSMLKN